MKSWRFLAITLVLAACSEDPVETDPLLNIDRPIDVAFACGRAGAVAPLADCAAAGARPIDTVDDNDNDPSDDTYSVFFFAFALESETGTLAITRFPALRDAPSFQGEADAEANWRAAADPIDVDPLTPRVNGIAVGATPIAVGTDRDACHLVTANAGSCDLSVVDVKGLLDGTGTNLSTRTAVVDAAGQPVLARPAAMAAEPSTTPAGTQLTCPGAPTGLVYVAYPGCHSVAAVRAATGQIEAHIDFAADGTATVVRDGNLVCPAECGVAAPATPGPRPTTLDLLADPRTVVPRLAIGAEDSNRVTIVDLDATFLPTAVRQATLEGDIGIIDVALTPTMAMGGSDGVPEAGDDLGGDAQFVYAVATDTTIRVAEISQAAPVECDTQIDPRYLGNVTDVAQLSCLPVGSPSLPRRAGALGPGIELTGAAIPTAVTVVRNAAVATQLIDEDAPAKVPDPGTGPEPVLEGRLALVGTFAFVASSVGVAFIVNIDDDSFPDVEDPANPLAIELTQALPHSLRDQVENRSSLATVAYDPDKNPDTPAEIVRSCSVSEPDPEATDPTGGSRQAGLIGRQSDTSTLAIGNLEFSPGIRHVACVGQKIEATNNTLVPDVTTVSELAFQAPPEVRAASFPDLAALPFSHFWRFTWEGLFVDEVRQALVPVDGFGMRVQDAARPFCSLGVEPYDSVQLIGCDPTRGDFDCGVGETCFVHPDAQTGSAGACLPSGEVDFLAGPCRDFLVSRRRYAVAQAEAGQLKLTERRRVLRTTPLSGCTSEQQCDALARHEAFMAIDKDPFERTAEDEPDPKNWACEPDPSRAGAGTINRCVQRCNDDLPRDTPANEAVADAASCEAGNVCAFKGADGWGRCVEGIVPPLQCVRGRQRYVLRATDAFVVTHIATGSTTQASYDHAIVADSAGACVRDPAANPLLVSRIPLRPAPCTGDASSPNPCLTQVTNREDVLQYAEGGETCDTNAALPERQTDRTPRERVADAIRVQLPGFTTHVIDPTYPGDAVCRGDRQGGLVDVPYVALGTQLQIRITSGFSPQTITSGAEVYPVNIVRGPDNTVWLVDEGKHVSDSYRGGLLRYNVATGRGLQIK